MADTTTLPPLRPCPFAGHPTVVLYPSGSVPTTAHHRLQSLYWVQCEQCQASGPLALTADEAVAAWNARVAATPEEGI